MLKLDPVGPGVDGHVQNRFQPTKKGNTKRHQLRQAKTYILPPKSCCRSLKPETAHQAEPQTGPRAGELLDAVFPTLSDQPAIARLQSNCRCSWPVVRWCWRLLLHSVTAFLRQRDLLQLLSKMLVRLLLVLLCSALGRLLLIAILAATC